MLAFDARGICKRAVALHNLLRQNTGICLDIVNILSVVGQELSLVLKKTDESVCWRKFLLGGENVLGN